MKHPIKRIIVYAGILSLFLVCFLAAAYFIAYVSGSEITFAAAEKQVLVSFVGLILLALFYFLISLIHPKHRQRAHNSYFSEIEEALDRISKGDFDIRIGTAAPHRGKHISELTEKVNNMALELSGMETMREDFVSNVSHEIQSPLTSIKGFVSLMKDDNLSREEQLHYVEIVEAEVLRLSKLSENLLRLSTLDAESAEINPQTYSLSKQLKDVILILEPQWSDKSIDISLSDKNVDIIADKALLSQVWINLLNNSIKFTSTGGSITISVSCSATETAVSISDSGIGMTEKDLTHIFERFYMADKARSLSSSGSGLGLAIVKKIIQMHNGKIDVESRIGKGTAFTITIPIKNSSV